MEKLAFLGVGLIGGALAEAAVKRGDDVTVWNRSPEKAEALGALGARIAATPADAVRGADRVHIVVNHDATVDALLEAARPGLGDAIVCDHTTASPAGTAERAARCERDGIAFLHCPVFMGPAAARAGTGTIMVAGPKARFDSVQAGLAKMAAEVWYVGERPDLAAVYKLAGNAMIIGVTGIVADVLQIAATNGVDANDAVGVFGRFDLNGIARTRVARMASGDFGALFALDMARKDVRLMVEASGEGPLAVLPGLAARMDELIAQGEGHRDLAVLARDSRR